MAREILDAVSNSARNKHLGIGFRRSSEPKREQLLELEMDMEIWIRYLASQGLQEEWSGLQWQA
jgi:hypothetical protein